MNPVHRTVEDKSAWWRLVQRAFDATVDLDGPSRDAVLAEVVAGDRQLESQVLTLLEHARAEETALDRGALTLLEAAAITAPDGARTTGRADDAVDLTGTVAAGYTITQRISSGGMGDVWLGQREFGGARRRVAIKILKRGLDTDGLLRRFRLETETLAALHHPGIVAFLDAGALADGRPFFVMEYVDGETIDRFAQANALSLEARLSLFLETCAAVRFAHANLVLHRDLKPSNIIVAANGRAKLLDFGVAKVLDPQGATTHETQTPLPLTPRYAAPEQARGDRASVATDVWGLGLVLYELLVGVSAFPDRTLGDVLVPVADAQVPIAPSAVSTLRDAAVVPVGRKALRGDLDAVVLRALREAPGERYPSVEALQADVQRVLDGVPVQARRAGFAERATRVARRHRWATLASFTLLAVVAAGLIGLWTGKREAERHAGRGWGAHAQAAVASNFLEELLAAGGDAAALPPGELQARLEALDGKPEAEARVRIALGRAAVRAGRLDDGRAHLTRALELAETHRAAGSRGTARALLALGRLEALAGNGALAKTRLQEVIALCDRQKNPDARVESEAHRLLTELDPE